MKYPNRGGACSSRYPSGAVGAQPMKIIAFLLSVILVLSLGACSGGDKQSAYHPASGESLEYIGHYTAFGMVHDDYRDYLVDLGEGNSSEMTLKDDGTGTMTLSFESAEGVIEKWKVEGGLIDVTVSNRTMFGPAENGNVVKLYFEKETLTIYYAKDGADISSYNVLTQEEFKESVAAALSNSSK